MKFRSLFAALLMVFALVGMACDNDEEATDLGADVGGDVTDTTDDTDTTQAADDTTTTEAAGGDQLLTANLAPLNESGDSGSATVELLDGNRVRVTVETHGVSNQPHAQHIHIGGRNECPEPALSGDDEFISTAEGKPAYGAVQVSLTTEGAVGADSALAIPRFPTASNNSYTYERTFELPADVTAADVRNGVVVVHGIAELFADQNAYDGEPRSSLDPSLPLEATIPTLCGKLS